MLKFFCDRCGVEMNQKKYREGYRLPDPNPKYNAWDEEESEDPSSELIVCEVCKRAYINFIKEGKNNENR